MSTITPKEVIDTVIDAIVSSYGNLGYTSFRVHSIKPNHKQDVYVAKYSFIPRDKENKRVFYETRINIKDKNMFETKEISEKELIKENDN